MHVNKSNDDDYTSITTTVLLLIIIIIIGTMLNVLYLNVFNASVCIVIIIYYYYIHLFYLHSPSYYYVNKINVYIIHVYTNNI